MYVCTYVVHKDRHQGESRPDGWERQGAWQKQLPTSSHIRRHSPEPEFVNVLTSPGIDSACICTLHGGPVLSTLFVVPARQVT
jgi:hypothetical protein